MGLSPARFRVLAVLFGISGGAGLVDQVCFSKYLSYVVGATAYAVSAVLAAFMTGLTLGAYIGGRLSERTRHHVRAYGIAEMAVGAAVAVSPVAFGALTPLYVDFARGAEGSLPALTAARWTMAMLLVVAPTTAMGMTLPLVSPALAPSDDADALRERERRVGLLYAANTAGGAIGALSAAYFIMPALGIAATLYTAAAVSASAGAAAVVLARGARTSKTAPAASKAQEASISPEHSSIPIAIPALGVLTAVAFASGALVFVAEVVGTHLLAVIVGNSAYAFGLILAVFLVCLFTGAALAPRAHRRHGEAALPGSLALSGITLALTVPLWDRLPFLFMNVGEYLTSFEAREAYRAFVSFAVLAVPVTFMGLTFPLLLQRVAGQPRVGRLIGRLTAVNTVGAVVGALAAGYLILPLLGSRWSFLAVAITFAGAATLTLRGVEGRRRTATLAVAGATAVVAVASPSWQYESLTAGTNVYFDSGGEPDDVLFVREDVHGGITTVTQKEDVYTLYTNGKFQGNTGWEMNAQRYFAHYPCLFVDRFDRALVIGLGTGTTLGTLATYPWKELEVVEISPSIVEAAGRYFTKPNRGVLENDPRVRMNLDDARNWLLVNDGQFDLISMELSSIWFAGASALYSDEFYRIAKPHLASGGVFQQWVQLHHVFRTVFATIVNTLRRHFEHVALFYGGGQGILVASDRELTWSQARAARLEKAPGIADTLPDGRALVGLTNDVLLMNEGLDRFIADSAAQIGRTPEELVSTDDNLYLEYETPRGNVLPWVAREELVAVLRAYRDQAAVDALARTE